MLFIHWLFSHMFFKTFFFLLLKSRIVIVGLRQKLASFRASTPGNSTPAGGCNTPTTPSTPLSAPGDLMSQLATLSKFDGMISYVSHACSAGAKSGAVSFNFSRFTIYSYLCLPTVALHFLILMAQKNNPNIHSFFKAHL